MTLYLFEFSVDAAVVAINTAVDAGSAEATLQSLLNEYLDLSAVESANAHYYQQGLQEKKRAKPNGRLTEKEVQDCITEMNAKAEMDRLGEFRSK